jgi:lipopolysaccharide export system permease protein
LAKFDRYLLSQLTMLFGFFSLVLVGVYWVNRAVALFDQIIADGQSAGVFLELTALTLPNVIRIVLPISAFAAAVYVANRLMSESELVVAQAAGLGPFRLARAPLVFGLIVSALLAVLAHFLVPASRAELSERRAEIAQNVTARFLVEGRFMHPTRGLTVYVRDISETGELEGVFLSDDRAPQRTTTYTATRAFLVRSDSGPVLVMLDGMAQIYERDTGRLSSTRFSDFAYDLAGLIDGGAQGRVDERELPTSVLLNPDDEVLAATRKPASVLLYEAHSRFAQPFLGLVGALVGFSAMMAGGFSRFGLWRQVALAVAALIFVQFLDNAVADRVLTDARLLPLVYLPVAVGLLVAAALLAWAGRTRRRPRAAGVAP